MWWPLSETLLGCSPCNPNYPREKLASTMINHHYIIVNYYSVPPIHHDSLHIIHHYSFTFGMLYIRRTLWSTATDTANDIYITTSFGDAHVSALTCRPMVLPRLQTSVFAPRFRGWTQFQRANRVQTSWVSGPSDFKVLP